MYKMSLFHFIVVAFCIAGFDWHEKLTEEIFACKEAQQHLMEYRNAFGWRRHLKTFLSFFNFDSFVEYKEPDAEGFCSTPLLMTVQEHFGDCSNDETLERVLEYALQWQTIFYRLLPVLAVLVSCPCLLYFVYTRLNTQPPAKDQLLHDNNPPDDLEPTMDYDSVFLDTSLSSSLYDVPPSNVLKAMLKPEEDCPHDAETYGVKKEDNEQEEIGNNNDCESREASQADNDDDSQIQEKEADHPAVTAIEDFTRQMTQRQLPVPTPNPSRCSYGYLKYVRRREFQFRVDTKYIELVVEKGLLKYKEEFGVNVDFIIVPNTNTTFVTLYGKTDDVHKVYDCITARLDTRQELEKPLEQPQEVAKGLHQVASSKYVFRILTSQKRWLIGRSGANVRDLQEKFGVIILAHPVSHEKYIDCVILGKKDDVLGAFREICSKVRIHMS